MTRLVPEKTVELHTAFSIVNHLGPETLVWSYTRGLDQGVWSDTFLKMFMLELKAPIDIWNPYFEIDIQQLRQYTHDFRQFRHPDVLYVFPTPRYRLLYHFILRSFRRPSFQKSIVSRWPGSIMWKNPKCQICLNIKCSCPICQSKASKTALYHYLSRQYRQQYPTTRPEHLLHFALSFHV